MTVSVSAVVAIVGISCGFSISFSLGGGISHGGEKSNCESEILHIDYQAIGFVRRTEALQRQQAYLYQKFFGLGGVRSLPEISMQVISDHTLRQTAKNDPPLHFFVDPLF